MVISLRLTTAERDSLAGRARQAGKTLSDFARGLLLDDDHTPAGDAGSEP